MNHEKFQTNVIAVISKVHSLNSGKVSISIENFARWTLISCVMICNSTYVDSLVLLKVKKRAGQLQNKGRYMDAKSMVYFFNLNPV